MWKLPKKWVCGNISPQSKKLKNSNKRKRKGKERESYIFIVYIIFNINPF